MSRWPCLRSCVQTSQSPQRLTRRDVLQGALVAAEAKSRPFLKGDLGRPIAAPIAGIFQKSATTGKTVREEEDLIGNRD